MLRLFALAALVTAAHAGISCVLITHDDAGNPKAGTQDCSKVVEEDDGDTIEFIEACYIATDEGSGGCLPVAYAGVLGGVDASPTTAPECTSSICWCFSNKCNTAEWGKAFAASYVPPDRCYGGIAGANTGAKCHETATYESTQYENPPQCSSRIMYEDECRENNEHIGGGDGCGDNANEGDCVADRPNGQKAAESFDGSTRNCLWLPPFADTAAKKLACEVDNQCDFQTGTTDTPPQCNQAASVVAKTDTWEAEKGELDCEDRVARGCFKNEPSDPYNRETHGECYDREYDESTCNAITIGDGCNTCTGDITKTGDTEWGDRSCAERGSDSECNEGGGCTWGQAACCKWVDIDADDLEEACHTNVGGSAEGLCKFDDGNGAPRPEIVVKGFENNLFSLSPADPFDTRCAMVASFRASFGAAVVLGADKVDIVGKACESRGTWEAVADDESVMHTKESIAEYCQNFVPDTSAMDALKDYSPAQIIAKTKNGEFEEMMSGLAEKKMMYIVTADPSMGECLLAGNDDFGFAVCTCDSIACNDVDALKFITDPDTGPMRLLQFLDGSLSSLADAINAEVPGLIGDDGKIDVANIGNVKEADIDAIMAVAGVSDLTSKAELWALVQDYAALQSTMASCQTDGECEKIPDAKGSVPTTSSTTSIVANVAGTMVAALVGAAATLL